MLYDPLTVITTELYNGSHDLCSCYMYEYITSTGKVLLCLSFIIKYT